MCVRVCKYIYIYIHNTPQPNLRLLFSFLFQARVFGSKTPRIADICIYIDIDRDRDR